MLDRRTYDAPREPAVFYIWTDHLGSPRQITDAANQSRWEWPNNDPFGNNLPNENPSGLGTFTYNLRFPGQYYDAETGKHYNYFRDYDPGIGRYVQSDPLGVDVDNNTFVFVLNGPLTTSDPTGLEPPGRTGPFGAAPPFNTTRVLLGRCPCLSCPAGEVEAVAKRPEGA